MSLLSNEDEEVNSDLCIEDATGYLRLRRTAGFSLTYDLEHVSVVFIEAAPIQMRLTPTTGDDV
jgi:hypothetical protein